MNVFHTRSRKMKKFFNSSQENAVPEKHSIKYKCSQKVSIYPQKQSYHTHSSRETALFYSILDLDV